MINPRHNQLKGKIRVETHKENPGITTVKMWPRGQNRRKFKRNKS